MRSTISTLLCGLALCACGGAVNDASSDGGSPRSQDDGGTPRSPDDGAAPPSGDAASSTPPDAATGDAGPLPSADFQTRCAATGVLRCVGFDEPADFFNGAGDANGAYGGNKGLIPPSGTADYTRCTRDTGVKSSGASSLKFTVPMTAGSDTSGAYFANFSDDLSVQFGENAEFYVQWRQRFSPEFLNNKYAGTAGWKQAIIGTGDQPGTTFSSCSSLELVTTNYELSNLPIMYNSCSGSTSHGAYDGFYQPFGGSDFKLQNARPAPYCLYSQSSSSYFAPTGNCFGYVADEWMTFQVGVKTGPRVNDEFTNSHVSLWVAREGQPSEPVLDWGPYNLSAGSTTDNERYGKVWLLPYMTNKDETASYPVAYTWYDELIVSRSRIADPQ
jgi:hypothetical protein